jgi:hypothetical protein
MMFPSIRILYMKVRISQIRRQYCNVQDYAIVSIYMIIYILMGEVRNQISSRES